MYHMTTLSPWLICCPRSSVSSIAVRRMYNTGVAQRMISSTALFISSGWALRSASWSGLSIKAFIPCVSVVRVVSLPAKIRI